MLRLPFGGHATHAYVQKYGLCSIKSPGEALFLDVAIGAMTPKRESKHELVMYTYI